MALLFAIQDKVTSQNTMSHELTRTGFLLIFAEEKLVKQTFLL